MITDTFHEIARPLKGEDRGVAMLGLLAVDGEGFAAVEHKELHCGNSATTTAMWPDSSPSSAEWAKNVQQELTLSSLCIMH